MEGSKEVQELKSHGTLRSFCKANDYGVARSIYVSAQGNPIVICQPKDGRENVRVVLSKRAAELVPASGLTRELTDTLLVQEREDKGLIVTSPGLVMVDLD